MESRSVSPPFARVELEIAHRLDQLAVGPWHRRLVALVGIGTFFSFFEVALGSVLVPLLPAAWVVTTTDKSLVIGSAFIGEVIGVLLLAPLADRFGRRTMFQANLAIYAVFSVISAFATDLPMFVVLRILVGVGLGAELTLVDSYLAELLPAAQRGRLIGRCYLFGYFAPTAVGLAAALLPHRTAGTDSWRLLLVFSALGAVIVWSLRRRLPESPRWLAVTGRSEEALAATANIENNATRSEAPAAESAPQSALAPPREYPTTAHTAPAGAEAAASPRMWRPPLLSRTLLVSMIWLCQTIGFYGFAAIAPLVLIQKGFSVTKSLGYTGLTAIGYPIGALLMMMLAERIQRKHLLVAAAMLVAGLGVVFGVADTAWLIIAAGFALTVVNVVMGNVTHAYTSEMFPTALRATANGRTYSLSRVVSAVLPFFALTVLYNLGAGTLYLICAAVLVVMSIAVTIWGPRTNKRQLESI